MPVRLPRNLVCLQCIDVFTEGKVLYNTVWGLWGLVQSSDARVSACLAWGGHRHGVGHVLVEAAGSRVVPARASRRRRASARRGGPAAHPRPRGGHWLACVSTGAPGRPHRAAGAAAGTTSKEGATHGTVFVPRLGDVLARIHAPLHQLTKRCLNELPF